MWWPFIKGASVMISGPECLLDRPVITRRYKRQIFFLAACGVSIHRTALHKATRLRGSVGLTFNVCPARRRESASSLEWRAPLPNSSALKGHVCNLHSKERKWLEFLAVCILGVVPEGPVGPWKNITPVPCPMCAGLGGEGAIPPWRGPAGLWEGSCGEDVALREMWARRAEMPTEILVIIMSHGQY